MMILNLLIFSCVQLLVLWELMQAAKDSTVSLAGPLAPFVKRTASLSKPRPVSYCHLVVFTQNYYQSESIELSITQVNTIVCFQYAEPGQRFHVVLVLLKLGSPWEAEDDEFLFVGSATKIDDEHDPSLMKVSSLLFLP